MTYTHLIQKRTPATLLEFIPTTPSSVVLFVAIIGLIFVIIRRIQLSRKRRKVNKIRSFYNLEQPILDEIIALKRITVIILLLGISAIYCFAHNLQDYYKHNSTIWKHATLVDIKNQVHINNNKLTIDTLPENYKYNANLLTHDEPHDFQIVKNDFYQDAKIHLIDKDQREYELSSKDFDELMRK